MKSTILNPILFLSLLGCIEKKVSTSIPIETLAIIQDVPEENINAKPGMILLQDNDCLTCHDTKIDRIGPSFHKIIKKYPFTIENKTYLTEKIIEGGSGVWGEVPMNSHVDLGKDEVEQILEFIYSQEAKSL